MITFNIFQGLNALNLFIKDFQDRGHKTSFIKIFLVVFWIFTILSIPLLLFIDLCILIYNIFEKKQKKEFIGKSYKKKKGKK